MWAHCGETVSKWNEIDKQMQKHTHIVTNIKANDYKTLFFHSFHSQRKIHESYLCIHGIPQIFAAYTSMPQIFVAYSVYDWGILSMPQISVANTSMPQIFVAYTCMTCVSSFENGRNEKIISSM